MSPGVASGESKNVRLQRKIASVVSGSASGAVVSLALQPLDVIRTQLQAQAVAVGQGPGKNVVTTVQDLWSAGGLRNFWRGSGPTVWRLSLGLGIQFLTLETLTDALLSRRATGSQGSEASALKNRELRKLDAFFAGGMARGVAAAATVPFTIVKTRMEFQGAGAQIYKGTFSVLSGIVQREGVAGIFRGIGPTIMTNAPFSALYYMFYSDLKRRLQPEGKTTSLVNFTSGTFAAIAATLLTQPTDMIRTQMQLGSVSNAGLGSLAMLRHIVATKGAGVLLAGAAPRVLKRTLQTALVWTLYEELKPFLMQQAQRLDSERDS